MANYTQAIEQSSDNKRVATAGHFVVTLRSRCRHYIFALWFRSIFFFFFFFFLA